MHFNICLILYFWYCLLYLILKFQRIIGNLKYLFSPYCLNAALKSILTLHYSRNPQNARILVLKSCSIGRMASGGIYWKFGNIAVKTCYSSNAHYDKPLQYSLSTYTKFNQMYCVLCNFLPLISMNVSAGWWVAFIADTQENPALWSDYYWNDTIMLWLPASTKWCKALPI